MLTRAHSSGPVLILARPEDPIASGFAQYAESRGLAVWRPERLEDIGWTFSIEDGQRSVEFCDWQTGGGWSASDLAGIWHQALPPLIAFSQVEEDDRRYVATEFLAVLRAVLYGARCLVIGQPPSHLSATTFDLGLESRVELRRLGLPALTDHVGTIDVLRTAFEDCSPARVRITRLHNNESFWLSDVLVPNSAVSVEDGEVFSATYTDSSSARVALYVDSEVLVVEFDSGNTPVAVSDDGSLEIETMLQLVRQVTRTRFGLAYLAHQPEGWKIARLAQQIPHWLAEPASNWLNSRLFALFRET